MARNKITTLEFEASIKAIEGTDHVMYRHGVWNSYYEVPTAAAIESIRRSGYGADVSEDNGIYYVSIPCDSDMW